MFLAQGPQRSDAGEARTRGLSVSSQALFHWATALPSYSVTSSWASVCSVHIMMVSYSVTSSWASVFCSYHDGQLFCNIFLSISVQFKSWWSVILLHLLGHQCSVHIMMVSYSVTSSWASVFCSYHDGQLFCNILGISFCSYHDGQLFCYIFLSISVQFKSWWSVILLHLLGHQCSVHIMMVSYSVTSS